MKLLITKQEYQAHSALPAITSNHENVDINTNDFVYCNIIDANAFSQIEQGLNADNYATDIFLPKSAFKKK